MRANVQNKPITTATAAAARCAIEWKKKSRHTFPATTTEESPRGNVFHFRRARSSRDKKTRTRRPCGKETNGIDCARSRPVRKTPHVRGSFRRNARGLDFWPGRSRSARPTTTTGIDFFRYQRVIARRHRSDVTFYGPREIKRQRESFFFSRRASFFCLC